LKKLLQRALAWMGLQIIRTQGRYAQDGFVTIHSDRFRDTSRFVEAYGRGLKASAGVDPQFEWRVHVALWAATMGLRVPGDFVECGVNAGFMSSAVMHHLQWRAIDRRFYLVDTFAGPPLKQYDASEVARGRRRLAEEALQAGAYVTDIDRVRQTFAEWPNAIVVQGVVPDILPMVRADAIAFLHIDMNCAYPERAAFEFFWSRLSPGAVVLFDDYGNRGHEAQGMAIDAAAASLGAHVLALPTGQGIVIK